MVQANPLVLSAGIAVSAAAAIYLLRARRMPRTITILGLGSLLSERSCRLTFPTLTNFRVSRLDGYRRVFAHSPSVFVQRGIADVDTLQMSSLSAEPCAGSSFVVTAFEVPDSGLGMEAFREREEEFELAMVDFTDAFGGGRGMLCLASTDAAYIERWGKERWERLYTKFGLSKCWGWTEDSGLRPCATYLRHCTLAAEKLGGEAHASFLDDTFLCDRKTTIRSYLQKHPEVMSELPPEALRERYSG